jgi:DNA-directed RNA polymerase specialized sigma24 family protein
VLTEPQGFRDYVAARQRALLRTAQMLTGDEHAAEDLVQAALERVWPRWEGWWRRKWRGEPSTSDLLRLINDPRVTQAER